LIRTTGAPTNNAIRSTVLLGIGETSGKSFQGEGFAAGVLLALMKVVLSVLSGVYGETCFKLAPNAGNGVTAPELHVQMTQIAMSATLAGWVTYARVV